MKITINTDILKKYELSLGDFLVLLLGYQGTSYLKCYSNLQHKGLVEPNIFEEMAIVLSDNTKNLVAKILMESDDRAVKSGIDFSKLAVSLMHCYPKGNKPGTTYDWRGKEEEIAQKLRTLVVKYDFQFTEEEAIAAVREYVASFKDYKYMQLLKYFILKTTDDGQGHKVIDSLFMTIIENNRESHGEDSNH